MDMVNGRFINDTNVAQAIAGFLDDVGITVTLNVLEFGAFNGAIFSHQSSPMYFASWGNPVFDPAFIFDFITRTRRPPCEQSRTPKSTICLTERAQQPIKIFGATSTIR